MSAVVGDILTAPERAGKPDLIKPGLLKSGLLMSLQLAYLAAGLAGAIIIDNEFSTG